MIMFFLNKFKDKTGDRNLRRHLEIRKSTMYQLSEIKKQRYYHLHEIKNKAKFWQKMSHFNELQKILLNFYQLSQNFVENHHLFKIKNEPTSGSNLRIGGFKHFYFLLNNT